LPGLSPPGGRDLAVRFTGHAVRQICDRTASDWRTYAGSGDAFAYLENCVYYEEASGPFDSPCFAIYDRCADGYIGGALAVSLIGRPVWDADNLYCRIGYCPAVIDGEFIVAKTLLLPGMSRTPERVAFDRAQLSPRERAYVLDYLEAFFAPGRSATHVGNVLRCFHLNGFPQVVRIHGPVFRYD
jgi:hypothetical protein